MVLCFAITACAFSGGVVPAISSASAGVLAMIGGVWGGGGGHLLTLLTEQAHLQTRRSPSGNAPAVAAAPGAALVVVRFPLNNSALRRGGGRSRPPTHPPSDPPPTEVIGPNFAPGLQPIRNFLWRLWRHQFRPKIFFFGPLPPIALGPVLGGGSLGRAPPTHPPTHPPPHHPRTHPPSTPLPHLLKWNSGCGCGCDDGYTCVLSTALTMGMAVHCIGCCCSSAARGCWCTQYTLGRLQSTPMLLLCPCWAKSHRGQKGRPLGTPLPQPS